jgi:flagellar FliL protein
MPLGTPGEHRMSSAPAKTADPEGTDAPAAKGGKKKLLLIAVPVLLIGAGGGLWFMGMLPFLGGKHAEEKPHETAAVTAPVYVELPQIVANLNAGPRRTSFVKLQAKLELSKPEDVAAYTAAQPKVMDLFQTYLRDMRPEELRGSIGTYRLREQLMARASLAAAPARVVDVLFTELLVQ